MRRELSLLQVILAALLLGACAMAQSTLVAEGPTTGCESTAGSYFLSKSHVRVVVGGDTPPTFYLKSVRITHRPDKAHKYCLDYLGSPTANEGFVVARNAAGLLQRIYSNSEDQSGAIAKTLANTVFTAVSGNSQFSTDRSSDGATPATPDIFTAEYDPFDEADTALMNDGLRYFGFCLVLEGANLSHSARSIDEYCDRPLHRSSRERAMREQADYSSYNDHVIKEVRGILYRPRVAHVLYLFQKRNLKLSGGWELRASEAVHLENRSPILSVGVDRAFFASRKTNLVFDDGVLHDINIDKKSELAGFVEVPLYIAQGIAALPANIVQVRINANTSKTNLINAQSKLIDAKTQHLKALADLKVAAGSAGATASGAKAGAVEQPDLTETPRSAAPIPAQASAPAATDLEAEYGRCVAGTQSAEVASANAQKYCSCVWRDCANKAGQTNIEACKQACSGRAF